MTQRPQNSIVVFGATGYTGRLIVEELVRSGTRPVIAGRSETSLAALSEQHGGLSTRTADVSRPDSVRALVRRGDVLLSTVGPFAKWGGPAIEAAIEAGATYLDSTGEPAFIRRVFEHYGPKARKARVGLLTAAGFDYVPGNAAAAFALEAAGPTTTRVDVSYFLHGNRTISAGTHASMIGTIFEPGHAFRAGRLIVERATARARPFVTMKGRIENAASVGGSEQFTIPALYPNVRDVNVFLAVPLAKLMPLFSAVLATLAPLPGGRRLIQRISARPAGMSTDGPDAASRATSSSLVVAEAFGRGKRPLTRVELHGANPYEFTARFMAWAAIATLNGEMRGTGALGPVEAFGLEGLRAAVEQSGCTIS